MLALWLWACDTTSSTGSLGCFQPAPTLSPTTAAAGDRVTLDIPVPTYAWDVAVKIGGVSATVLSVTGDDCLDCDQCAYDEGCTGCGECSACDSSDACASCAPQFTVEVPALAAGTWDVVVITGAGALTPVALVVTGADTGDTGGDTAETGSTGDTGGDTSDTGDTAGVDTGDTTVIDTGDTAATDTAATDTATTDTATTDTAATDTAATDTGATDTGTTGGADRREPAPLSWDEPATCAP